ncbi:hypothetical protein EPUS_03526 [Endocarpon pusillum Z07020]|uniref:Uncharacterized protein n=1 Tax=Endocarpon pusillum (strain Z07020 / HMAS-L-300199) TaxID=1263415 RepID=U1HLU3_ENDPU|nr:uncharacterized protein EPUS_03526 [Endocarpon pusillum Z07020]ERF69974.1 hypothetical protein EPUS_03526 [Endocarpon pusillum Z07020]
MDHVTAPGTIDKPPTSSTDPRQQAHPDAHTGTTKDITAHDTVPTSADGIEGTRPGATDGPKNPDPSSSSGQDGTGTEYHSHMKGTAAPGSHSELFGLTPEDGQVHPPPKAAPGSGPGMGVIGTSGHRGSMNTSSSAQTGLEGGESGKPSLMDKLNPMKDSDGDGKKGIGN